MKKNWSNTLFTFALIMVSACGPNPQNTPAPKNDVISKVSMVQSLKHSGQYAIAPATFAFFLWPEEKDLAVLASQNGPTSLQEVAEIVAENSSKMDMWYSEVIQTKNELSLLEILKNKLFDQEFQPYYDEQFTQLLNQYACYEVNSTTCVQQPFPDDNTENIKSPQNCMVIINKPWKRSREDRQECLIKSRKFEGKFEVIFAENHVDLMEQIAELNRKLLANGAHIKLNKFLEGITTAVDFNSEPDKYTNWIQTDSGKTSIRYVDDGGELLETPQITLSFRLNNLENNGFSEALDYKNFLPLSATHLGPDIVNVQMVMEDTAPTLKFRILEKRLISYSVSPKINGEERTGHYYEVSLRKSEQPFGLLFVGKVKKFNSQNVHLRDGMMKIIFLEEKN